MSFTNSHLSQSTARLGIYVGASGIGTGLAATLAYMNPVDIATYGQLMLVGGAGAGAGTYISTKIGPAELPQAVAAFHSWVFFTILNWTTFVYEMCVVMRFEVQIQ